MAESKFNKVWNILSNNNYTINEDVSEDVVCYFCKKIMINPYSGFCGCRYCYHCIKEYIGDERKHCPGNKEECLEEYLEMDRNLLKDLQTRYKIYNMTIKCPNELCLFRSKLCNIEDHFRICPMKPVECTFVTIGCAFDGKRKDNMREHLDLCILQHSQLLVEAINNVKNGLNGLRQIIDQKDGEISELKVIIERNRKEIDDVKESCQRKEMLMEEMTAKIDNLKEVTYTNKEVIEGIQESLERNETLNRSRLEILQDEMNNLKEKDKRSELQSSSINNKNIIMLKEVEVEIVRLKNEINELKIKEKENTKETREISKKEIDEIKDQIRTLKDNEQMRESKSEFFKNETKNEKIQIKKDLKMVKTEIVKIKKNIIHKYEEEVKHIKYGTKKSLGEIKKMQIATIIKLYFDIKEDFVWIIKDFTEKNKNNGVYLSDSFYIDDYNLCLRAEIIVYEWLNLSIMIKRGEKDEEVQWPLKHTIKVSIFNQDSLNCNYSWTINYDEYIEKYLFDKPQTNMNGYIYCGEVSLRDIEDTQGLLRDDSIVVTCSLNRK